MAEQQLDCEIPQPDKSVYDYSQTPSNVLDPVIRDALRDAKNRLVALRIEQSILGLHKAPDATATNSVILTNPFHRLLAHKVADYYKAGHRSVKDSIVLYKTWETAEYRPPRLSSLVSLPSSPSPSSSGTKSPGGTFVLKRNISQSSVNTLPTSQNDPQTTESDDNLNLLDEKPIETSPHVKLALRKAQYEEARQRIFQDQSEDNASDGGNSDDDHLVDKMTSNKVQKGDLSYVRK